MSDVIGYVICYRLDTNGKKLPVMSCAVRGVHGWICDCKDANGLPRWTDLDKDFHKEVDLNGNEKKLCVD